MQLLSIISIMVLPYFCFAMEIEKPPREVSYNQPTVIITSYKASKIELQSKRKAVTKKIVESWTRPMVSAHHDNIHVCFKNNKMAINTNRSNIPSVGTIAYREHMKLYDIILYPNIRINHNQKKHTCKQIDSKTLEIDGVKKTYEQPIEEIICNIYNDETVDYLIK